MPPGMSSRSRAGHRGRCSLSARRSALALALALAVGALSVAAGAPAAPRARSASYTPWIRAMVVGMAGNVMVPAEGVYASDVRLRVGDRVCTVAGGTPLAVLAAIRAAGGTGFALRDYGHCGSAVARSSQLVVGSVGGETNSGHSGWEYKVGGAAGGTGAADPSGPQGNGRRLSPGARVLWFWCVA